MTTQQLLNMTTRELTSMSEKELRQAVSTLRSTARKRHERQAEKEIYSPAEKYLHTSGRGDVLFPTVKGMDKTQLINEYARQTHYLKMKTSTITGVKEAKESIKTATEEITGRELTDDEVTTVWDITSQMQDSEVGGIFNYKDVANTVSDIIAENPDLSETDIKQLARERLTEIYEAEQQANSIYPSAFMQ